MAYSRAPRWSSVYNSTGPNVAPNSYQTIYDDHCSCRGTNWAPFLSCSARRGTARETGIPAPNAYYPKVEKSTIGGASLRYTAPRGAKEIPKRPPRPRSTRGGHPPRLKGFMYHCQVPYTLLGYPPTIPNIGHVGYKNLDDRTLVECCDPNYDITLGPAFYEVNHETFGDVYKGPYWSRYSGRKHITKSDIPGVGSYNIEPEPSSLDDYINKLRQERRKYSLSLRYADQLQMRTIRNNFPAPNQYNIEKVKCYSAKRVLVPKKLIRSRKIPRRDNTGPAPNQYNDPRTAFYSLVKPSCKKGLSAFLTKAPRFGKKSLEKTGPSFYMLPSFVDELAKKVSPYAVRNTAFDSSIPKKQVSLKYQVKFEEIPEETPPKPAPPPKPSRRHLTQRFKSFSSTYQASPASYNVRNAYAFTVMPQSFRKVAKYEFLSTEQRFAPSTDFFAVEDKSYIPGHIYNLKQISPCRRIITGSFPRAKRFPKGPENITPGPAGYALPSHLTRTFNVTLMETASLTPPQIQQMKLRGTYPHHKDHIHHKDHLRKMRKSREDTMNPSVKVTSFEHVPKCGF